MARIAGVDLPNKKRAAIGLTYIYGIGRTRSLSLLHRAGGRSEPVEAAETVEAETDPDYHAAGRDGLVRSPSHGP